MTVINKRVPPFAQIEVDYGGWQVIRVPVENGFSIAKKDKSTPPKPCSVLVNGVVRATFPLEDRAAADALAKNLYAERIATERELKRVDPAKYWRLRCEVLERLANELEAKLEAKVPGELTAFFKRWKMVIENRKNARKSRLGARVSDSDEITSQFRRLVREGHTEREARGIMNSWERWAKSTIYRKTKKSVL